MEDFSIRKTTAPEIDKETLQLAEYISERIGYDEDVGLVKYVDGKKIGVYFVHFSTYLAMKRNGKKPISFGIFGLVQKGDEFIVTEQAEKVLDVPGLGKLVDAKKKNGISFQGFSMEWQKDPIECAYTELEEELGLEKEDVKEVKRNIIILEDEVVFSVLFKTELEEKAIRKLNFLAIDHWEISSIFFKKKEEVKEFLKGTMYEEIFKKLVEP